MQDRIGRSYELHKAEAQRWAQIALDDVSRWKDRGECIRSLCLAYKHAGQAEMCASILSRDFGVKAPRAEISGIFNSTLDVAREKIIGAM